MTRLLCLAALALVFPLGVAAGRGAPPEPAPRLRLLVPAYFYPAGDGLKHWDRLITSAGRAPVVAVANVNSGPGTKPDPNYVKILDRAARAGVTLVGYVSTRYGKRPLQEVKDDVDRWLRLYPSVRGIFFDEQASGADAVGHYAALYAHARKDRGRSPVVTNPGTVCDAGYLKQPATDVACLFEAAKGFDAFGPPAWAERYPPARFAALAHGVADAGEMEKDVRAAVRKRIGYLYVTDGGGANPWDRLPRYWDREVEVVRQVNGDKRP
jgi:hypothetical protein